MNIDYGKDVITGGAIQQYNELQTLLLLESDEFKTLHDPTSNKEKRKRQQKKKLKKLKNKIIKSCEKDLNKLLRSLEIKLKGELKL